MINTFLIRKWAALLMVGLVTTIGFYAGIMLLGGFVWGLAGMGLMLAISAFVSNLMLRNPFTLMLEGKGILALDLNSTGVIRPFLVQVRPPYISARLDGKEVNDIFDRSTVFNLAAPVDVGEKAEVMPDGGLNIQISEEQYNRGRFAMFHYPVIIWNDQIKSIITKDVLGDTEKEIFAEHGVLYLNRKLEELTSAVRDFGRYVVENLKPKPAGISGGTWVIIFIVGALILLAILAGPQIIATLGGAAKSVGGAVSTGAGAAGSVIPK